MEEKKVRLQALLSRAGVASRRAAEKIILEGRVCVDGAKITELGVSFLPSSEIFVDGKKIDVQEEKKYILMNKPAGYVCSMSDEKNRPTAASLLQNVFSERLYNVGRLDMYSSGALIFTNDGDFAKIVSHPSSEIEKEYIVETVSDLPENIGRDFEKGILVDGIFYRAAKAKIVADRKMKIVLTEGKNREIRRVLASREIRIKSLKRIRIGCIFLKDLKSGKFREISKSEIAELLRLCKKRGNKHNNIEENRRNSKNGGKKW